MHVSKRGLMILISILSVIALPLMRPVTTVSAHETNACGDGQPTRWRNASTSQGYPSSWPVSYQDAIVGATTQFNTSDFDWFTDSQSSAKAQWGDLNNTSNTGLAGSMTGPVDCSTNPNYFQAVYLYYNFPHFNASAHTTAQKQCTAIHEMGHGVGLADNTFSPSIMYSNHNTRCHSSLITSLQSHDLSDINGKY